MRIRYLPFLLTLPLNAGAFEISGTVKDQGGTPVEGATVRVQTRETSTTSGADGSFHLVDASLVLTGEISITVGKAGYSTGDRLVSEDGLVGVDLQLRDVEPDDPNEDLSAFPPEFCKICHSVDPEQPTPGEVDLYGQGQRSRHAIAGRNSWVDAMLRDFRTRNPMASGFCADCHAPRAFTGTKQPGAVDLNDPDTVDLLALDANDPESARYDGVQCITCHRVRDVTTDIKAINFAGGAVLDTASAPLQVHGPWDDVFQMRAIPNPVFTQSLYCATCHEYERPAEGARPAIPGQSTFSEWTLWQARLPDDSPLKGVGTCQHCHMPGPTDGGSQFACNLFDTPRDSSRQPVRDHTFLGTTLAPGDNANLLDGAAGIDLKATRVAADELEVSAQITNLTAGHDLPTGIDLRNLLLIVEARDAAGNRLQPIAQRSTLLPAYAGTGTGPEDLAGRPGKGFAKFLSRDLNQVQNSQFHFVEFAEAVCEVQDNRIGGALSDTSSYVFRAPASTGPIKVLARAVFRRAPAGFVQQFGLPATDTLGNPLAEFELTRARLTVQPGFSTPGGTVSLDFEANANGAPFTGASALADTAFVPFGIVLSSRASDCVGSTSDGHAYAVLDSGGDRVLSPAPQARHNECDGGILHVAFPAPVGHVVLEIQTSNVGAGFEVRALDADGVEVEVQRVYDALSDCETHPVLQTFPIHLDHHGIAAIEARGLVETPLDESVRWAIKRLEVRFDSFHPVTTGPVATPTAGPPVATPTPTATPSGSQPMLSSELHAGARSVAVMGLLPGARVEIWTVREELVGEVLVQFLVKIRGAGTADEFGRAVVRLLGPLVEGENIVALDYRTLSRSPKGTVGELVPAPSAMLFVVAVLLIACFMGLRRPSSRRVSR